VFQNRVMRKIFGTNRKEITRVCRKFHSQELCRSLVGNYESKSPFGRHRHRHEINIKMDLTHIGWKGVEQINLTTDQWRSQVNTELTIWF
jgi:hypothetical protein